MHEMISFIAFFYRSKHNFLLPPEKSLRLKKERIVMNVKKKKQIIFNLSNIINLNLSSKRISNLMNGFHSLILINLRMMTLINIILS